MPAHTDSTACSAARLVARTRGHLALQSRGPDCGPAARPHLNGSAAARPVPPPRRLPPAQSSHPDSGAGVTWELHSLLSFSFDSHMASASVYVDDGPSVQVGKLRLSGIRSLAMATWSVSKSQASKSVLPHLSLGLHAPSRGLRAINSGSRDACARLARPTADTDVSACLARPVPVAPRARAQTASLHSFRLLGIFSPDLRERWASLPRPGQAAAGVESSPSPRGGPAAGPCTCDSVCRGLQAALLDEQVNDRSSCPRNLGTKNRHTGSWGRSCKAKCISLCSIQSSLFRNGPKSSSSHPRFSLPPDRA